MFVCGETEKERETKDLEAGVRTQTSLPLVSAFHSPGFHLTGIVKSCFISEL